MVDRVPHELSDLVAHVSLPTHIHSLPCPAMNAITAQASLPATLHSLQLLCCWCAAYLAADLFLARPLLCTALSRARAAFCNSNSTGSALLHDSSEQQHKDMCLQVWPMLPRLLLHGARQLGDLLAAVAGVLQVLGPVVALVAGLGHCDLAFSTVSDVQGLAIGQACTSELISTSWSAVVSLCSHTKDADQSTCSCACCTHCLAQQRRWPR